MAIYGANIIKNNNMEVDYSYDAIGKNSEVITIGDPLTIASGVISVAGGTATVIGIAVKTQTMASNNQTVAKIVPGYIPIDSNQIYLMGGNAVLTGNATDGGTYYKLIAAATGVMQIDVVSGVQTGANRVVEVVEVDPFNTGDLTMIAVRFVKDPYQNVTITA